MSHPAETLWYKLDDDAASTVIVDSSSNANHGVWTGGGNTQDHNAAGNVGGGMSFDGSHYIVPGTPLTAGEDCSVAFWIYLGATGALQSLFGGTAGYWDYLYIKSTYDKFNCETNTNGNGFGDLSLGSSIAGAWHHVVLVKDGANVAAWLDGVYKDTKSMANGTDPMTISRIGSGYATNLLGSAGVASVLDDFRLYSAVLSSDEIPALYAGGAGTEKALAQLFGNRRRRLLLCGQ